jgi:hypothetical protein
MARAMLEHALAYAAKGWQVLPCHTPIPDDAAPGAVRCSCRNAACVAIGKHPRTAHGLKDASADVDTLTAWWTRWPDANIGGVPGSAGLIAFDIDTPEHEATARGHGLYDVPTRSVVSPNGVHRYFRYAEPLENGATLDKIVVRARHGFVILPPSRGRNKTTGAVDPYRWDGVADVAELPVAVADRLRAGSLPKAARERVAAALTAPTLGAGDRHPALLTVAGTLAARGLDPAQALELVRDMNARRCAPPKDDAEVVRLVQDVYAADAGKRQRATGGAGDRSPEQSGHNAHSAAAGGVGEHAAGGPALAPRALVDVLPQLRDVRDVAHGGVPLPPAWACMAAVLGGMAPRALEDAHATNRARERAARNVDPASADVPFTGFRDHGRYLPPGLHIVTGQTGGGKTALAVNLTQAAAVAGHPVVYVSLELDAVELAGRLVALETGIAWPKLALRRALELADEARREEGIEMATGYAGRVRVLIPDARVTRAALAQAVRAATLDAWHTHGAVPLVIFDYLQAAGILQGDGGRDVPLREHIAAVAFELRRLSSQDLHAGTAHAETATDWPGCPVVALSITARANVASKERVPGFDGDPDALRVADLEQLKALPKEAGEVEASAVTAWVMALGDDAGDGTRRLTLRLAKNRMGPQGAWVPFTFNGRTGALTEAPDRYEPAVVTRGEYAARKALADELAKLKAWEKETADAEEVKKLRASRAAAVKEQLGLSAGPVGVVD